MMMQNPDDKLFKDLLSDYTTPVADDGFSESVLKTIEAETRKVERIRRFSIYGACFVGGVIAASQFPALIAMTAKIKFATTAVPDASALPFSYWSLVGIILLGFVLWAVLDRKASDLF
jgi:hypothetical protein